MTLLDWLFSWFHPKPTPTPPPQPPPIPPGDAITVINAARAKAGLKPLAEDVRLKKCAQGWAAQMSSMGYLMHNDPYLVAEAVGGNVPVGEVIAYGQPDAASVVQAWASDPPHARIMFGDYDHVGIGHAGSFWTADFARLG